MSAHGKENEGEERDRVEPSRTTDGQTGQPVGQETTPLPSGFGWSEEKVYPSATV